jgi:hypothetical protein
MQAGEIMKMQLDRAASCCQALGCHSLAGCCTKDTAAIHAYMGTQPLVVLQPQALGFAITRITRELLFTGQQDSSVQVVGTHSTGCVSCP